ncbi:MAG: MarR family transcriptional regulator [Bacilli bacterium]|nr:MarR family transcriptional regulator [Bacilli bacterium]
MEKLSYEKFLVYLRQFQTKIQKEFNEDLKKFHLSSTYLGIIMLLYDHKEGYSMSDLSRLNAVDNALMTRNIKELEKIDYIYRNREKESQRKYHICLTEKGKNVAKEIKNIIEKRQQDFLKLFSKDEQAILDQAISMVIQKFITTIKEGEE